MNLQLYFKIYYKFVILLIISNGRGSHDFILYYLGCYENFSGHLEDVGNTSLTSCVDGCKALGQIYTFASLKRGNECYCGNEFQTSTQENNCQERCIHSSNEYCGGKYYSVYSICPIGSHGFRCQEKCNQCQSAVPCMRHSGDCYLSKCRSTDSQCDLAHLLNEVNVAFNQPARQSSTYSHHHQAELAVDGKIDSDPSVSTCSQTEKSMNSWLLVDFKIRRSIKKVIIIDKDEERASTLQRAWVYLTNEPPNEGLEVQECGEVTNPLNITINCPRFLIKYRYLVITLPKKESLTICEIEAYIHECDCQTNEVCSYVQVHGMNHSRCTCKKGFFKENFYSQCTDVDECERNRYACDPDSTTCFNSEGSYDCQCKRGFIKDSRNFFKCNNFNVPLNSHKTRQRNKHWRLDAGD